MRVGPRVFAKLSDIHAVRDHRAAVFLASETGDERTSQAALGVNPRFACPVPEASALMATINDHATPRDKIALVRECTNRWS
jgi:hypothetical protein